jgi:hypothetical protein
MQAREFHKMLNGETAKAMPLANEFHELFSKMKPKEQRKLINLNEQPISEDQLKEIHLFIDSLRRQGFTKKGIERSVKDKFNITVV